VYIPRKAAVQITESARTFFKRLLSDPPRPEIVGIVLRYGQMKDQPRMAFKFEFVTENNVSVEDGDEPVSLEVVEQQGSGSGSGGNDGTKKQMVKTAACTTVPKPPSEAWNDGLPKLYVDRNAFLKVLGSTVDVDTTTLTPILYDKEGNRMDPNA